MNEKKFSFIGVLLMIAMIIAFGLLLVSVLPEVFK